MQPTCTAAILAGGQSRRMGTDKSLMLVGGQAMLQRVIDRLEPLKLPLLLVTNTPQMHAPFGLPMVADVRPDNGSLGGLYTALCTAETKHVLVVACDTPNLNTRLLAHLVDLASASDADAIVPRAEGRAHSLHAVYRQSVRAAAEAQFDQGILRISALFDGLRVRWVDEAELREFDPSLESFVNLNTPDDLANWDVEGR